MKRRTFTKATATLLASAPFVSLQAKEQCKMKTTKAKRLQKGDTIGLITPGSAISDKQYEKAVANLTGLGFKVKAGKHIRAKYGYVAGTDAQRLEDLHGMFADESVDGICCVRGGYGCTRLLPDIDYKLIRKNPKVLLGYSDITALLNAIFQETGLIGFHGPVGSSDFTDYTVDYLKKVLMEPTDSLVISRFEKKDGSPIFQPKAFHDGIAEGRLVGGNLTLLASMAGTDFGMDAKGKLVFLEDVGEKTYRIDRMLTQLLQSANLDQAAGIALGVFADCNPGTKGGSLTLMETFEDRLGGLGIPVFYGLSFGHVADMCTLPVGAKARLDTGRGELVLLEKGVY